MLGTTLRWMTYMQTKITYVLCSMGYLKEKFVNFLKNTPFILLALLVGCSESETPDSESDMVRNYYAQVEMHLGSMLPGYNELNDEINFTVPIVIKPGSDGSINSPVIEVSSYNAKLYSVDSYRRDALHDLLSDGIQLGRTEAADYSFKINETQVELLSDKDLWNDFVELRTLHTSGALQSIPMLPPKLPQQIGAKVSKVYQSGFTTQYDVILVTEQRMRVKFEGRLPETEAEQKSDEYALYGYHLISKESIQGWADYNPDTGELIQLKAMVNVPLNDNSKSYLQGFMAITNEPFIEPEERLSRASFHSQLTREEEKEISDAIENEISVFEGEALFMVQEEESYTRDRKLTLLALQQGAIAPVLTNYKLLDSQGLQMEQQLDIYHNNTGSILFGDSIKHRFFGHIEPVTSYPAFIEVTYIPESHEKHSKSLSIKEGQVAFTHPQFSITGTQDEFSSSNWTFTITELAKSETGYYSLYSKGNEVNVSSVQRVLEKEETGWTVSEKNIYQISVWFDEAPTRSIPLTWYEKPAEKTIKLPFVHAVKSIKTQPPTEENLNPTAVTGQYEKPTFDVNKHHILVSMPPYMVHLCDMEQTQQGSYQGSDYKWRPGAAHRPNEPYHFMLSAFNGSVWYFYNAKAEAKVMCHEATLLPLQKNVDYKQSTPWMIELAGKYSQFTWKQASEDLQAYNEKGEAIQWVIPSDDANFAVPTLKTWGEIDSVSLIQRAEPKVEFEQEVQFGALPE